MSTVCIDYAAPGLQAANFLTLFGALDRLGGFFVLGAVREIGPDVTAIVLAGVAGTAITADLGARKIREELDALQVLGVDPIKNLVVPRFLALMLVTGLFNIYAILFGIFGGLLAEVVNGYPLGPFWNTFFAKVSFLLGANRKTFLHLLFQLADPGGKANSCFRDQLEPSVIRLVNLSAFIRLLPS